MIIYTKGWTAKNVTSTPIVFDTKDIFYIKELGFSPRRSMVAGAWWNLRWKLVRKSWRTRWMKIGGSCAEMYRCD